MSRSSNETLGTRVRKSLKELHKLSNQLGHTALVNAWLLYDISYYVETHKLPNTLVNELECLREEHSSYSKYDEEFKVKLTALFDRYQI